MAPKDWVALLVVAVFMSVSKKLVTELPELAIKREPTNRPLSSIAAKSSVALRRNEGLVPLAFSLGAFP